MYSARQITLLLWSLLACSQLLVWNVFAATGDGVLWEMNAAGFQTAATADKGWVLADLTAEVYDGCVRLREVGEGNEGSVSHLVEIVPSARYVQVKVGLAEIAEQSFYLDIGGGKRKLFSGWNTFPINSADVTNGMMRVTLIQSGPKGEQPGGWADLDRIRLVDRPSDGLTLELLDTGRGDHTARIGDRILVSYYPSADIQTKTLEVDCFAWPEMSVYRFNADPLVLEDKSTNGVFSRVLMIDENAYAFLSREAEHVFGSVSCGGVDAYAFAAFSLDVQAVLDSATGAVKNALPPTVFKGANPDIVKYRALWQKYTQGVNLALGKKVLLPILPDYALTKAGETDESDLTDGLLSSMANEMIWFDKRTVGWYMSGAENGVNCLIDLGEIKAVDRVVIRALGGGVQRNLLFPREFKVLVSRDGNDYYETASLQKLMPGEKNQSDFERFFYLDEFARAYVYPFKLPVDAEARYVAISIAGSTGAVFIDEIAVMATDAAQGAPSNAAYERTGEKLVTEGIVVRPRIGELVLSSNVLLPNSFEITDMRSGDAAGKPAELIMDLPATVEIVHPTNGLSRESIEIEGEQYVRWRGELKKKSTYVPRQTSAYFISPGDANIDGKPAYFSVACENVMGARVQVPIKVIDVPAVTPSFKRMYVSLDWMGMPDFPNLTSFFEAWRLLGFNSINYFTQYLKETLPKDAETYLAEARSKGFRVTIVDSPFHVMAKGHKPGTEIFSQMEDGTSINLCPAYEGEYYDAEIERIAKTVKMIQPDFAFWDIECWYKGAIEASRCQRCVAGQKASGKSMDEYLKDLGTRKMKDLHEAVKKGSAGHKTPVVGSYNHHAASPVHDLIMDFNRFYPDDVDLAMPSMYVGGRALDVHTGVRKNYQLLGKKVTVPWLTPGTYGQYAPYKLEQMILETLLNGGCGITYYAYMDIDTPLQFYYHAKALAALAPYEDLLLDGEVLTELKGSNEELTYSAIQKGNEMLLLIGNYRRSRNGNTVITLPLTGNIEVTDLLTGNKRIDSVQGTTLNLEVSQDQVMLLHVKGTVHMNGVATNDDPLPGFVFDLRSQGAIGDGQTLDTLAIQRTVDRCHEAGGGIVFFPPGTYLTGTLELKSNVELNLAASATLKASTDRSDYRTFSFGNTKNEYLIFGRNATNIAVTGRGTIDGSGTSFFEPIPDAETPRMRVRDWRPYHMLTFVDCTDLLIRDVKLVDSPCYTVWSLGCTRIRIQGVTIQSNRWGPNTDGIDLDCCRDVLISDCSIDSGDDCIALKSDTHALGRPAACENVTVINCTLRTTCCGVRIGYEGDGPIRNCTFSNLVMHDTRTGVNMLVPRDVGGPIGFVIEHGPAIENISFSNLILDTKIAFYFWIGDDAAAPGGIRGISISDVIARTEEGCYIGGSRSNPIEDIRFANVSLTITGDLAPSFGDTVPYPFPPFGNWPRRGIPHGWFLRNVRGLSFDNVQIGWRNANGPWLSALRAEDVDNLDLNNVIAGSAPGSPDAPALDLMNARHVSIRSSRAVPGTGPFVRLSGQDSEAISLTGCDLREARCSAVCDDDVPATVLLDQYNLVAVTQP